MYIITYQLKSEGGFYSIYHDRLQKAKPLYEAMKKDKKIYFVTLSKVLEHAHP